MENCIFCKIINKEIPATIILENEKVIAFEDINKQTPVHILVVPKAHLDSVLEINQDNANIISEIHLAINNIAMEKGIDKTGFRIVNNCGKDADQTVKHIHYHILGGTHLGCKMG